MREKILIGKSFHTELCFEAVLKLSQHQFLKVYLEGLLKELNTILNTRKQVDWEIYCRIISTSSQKFKNLDWSSLTNSSVWKDFVSQALK